MLCKTAVMRQQTIRKSVTLEGVGLHSGKHARLTLSPAPPDSGIVFCVGAHGDPIPAAPESVVDSHYATTIGKNGTRIQTVEHLMAAAAGLGIDNLRVSVDGPEVPAADGSAKPFVALLTHAGRQPQSARRRPVELPHAVHVGGGARWIRVVPSDTFRISYTLDNDHPAIGTQVLSVTPTEESFVNECLYVHEIEGFAVARVEVHFEGEGVAHARLHGEPIDPARHQLGTVVKAATLHRTVVTATPARHEARLIVAV